MLLLALVVYWGQRWWFVRPVEKHLSDVIMEDTKPLVQQKQLLESQSAVQYELLQRDVKTIRQEWSYVESILQVIKNMMS